MCVCLWWWPNRYALSSVSLMHAFLVLLEQIAGAWTQRAPGAHAFLMAGLLSALWFPTHLFDCAKFVTPSHDPIPPLAGLQHVV